jgi:hypothetical protein
MPKRRFATSPNNCVCLLLVGNQSHNSTAPLPSYVASNLIFGIEWGLLRGKNAQNQWISEWWDKQANRWVERAERRSA